MPTKSSPSPAQRRIRAAIRDLSKARRRRLLNALLDGDHGPILAEHMDLSTAQLSAILSDGVTSVVQAIEAQQVRRQQKEI